MSYFANSMGKPHKIPGSKVYLSRDIEEAWVHQLSDKGCCRSVHESFDGDFFYSYNTVIGSRVRRKKKVAYVIDREGFSPTTGGHQAGLRGAVRGLQVFWVNEGRMNQDLSFTPFSLRDYYVKEFTRRLKDTHRMKAIRERQFLGASANLQTAIEVCDYFNISSRWPKALLGMHDEHIQMASKLVTAYEDKVNERTERIRVDKERKAAARHARMVKMAVKKAEEMEGKYRYSWTEIPEELNTESLFGHDFSLLEDHPKLRVEMLRIQLRQVKQGHERKHSELQRENWELEDKVEAAEEHRKKTAPYAVNLGLDRVIELE